MYAGFVEPSNKKPTRVDSNHPVLIRKMRGEDALSTAYSNMSGSSGKCIKSYVYHPKDRTKITCLIHGSENTSDECKFLGDFGTKYSKNRPNKYCRHEPTNKKKCVNIKRIII